jgi:ribosomal protein L20A (L18A)
MKKYQYQETLNINVEVYANSRKEAQDKVASALGSAFGSMRSLDQIDQDIRDSSFDTIEIHTQENERSKAD